jgi:hypothetical protein
LLKKRCFNFGSEGTISAEFAAAHGQQQQADSTTINNSGSNLQAQRWWLKAAERAIFNSNETNNRIEGVATLRRNKPQ